jgi:phosphate transport system permease protein
MSQAPPNIIAEIVPGPGLPKGPTDGNFRQTPPLLSRGNRALPRADAVLSVLVRASAITVLLMMAALVTVLVVAAAPSVKQFGLKFITGSSWRPNELEVVKRNAAGKMLDEQGNVTTDAEEAAKIVIPPQFGALPVIWGTAISSMIALVVAVPLSLGAALFLVRIASRYFVAPVSFLIEFLAAIPSIAYGIWGLFVLAPLLQHYVEPSLNSFFASVPGLRWLHLDGGTTGRDMFCGGLILGIMILPIITAVSRDVLRAVPRAQIEGTLALGATWWQSSWEMLRYSRSGLFGAVMLGLARAAGETMAVTMVIGNVAQIRAAPFAAAQTMSSLLANSFAEASTELERSALLEVALILLLMSLTFNVIARYLVVGKSARGATGA